MIESLNNRTATELPAWFANWERTGLILWLDNGDGVMRYSAGEDNEIFRSGALSTAELGAIRVAHQQWIDNSGAAGEDGRALMRQKKLSGPDQDIIVLATPEMAELASWIIALVAAGGLAAALSTASGLLLVISSSVAHDLYYRVLNPAATEKQRLAVGRAVIGLAVVIAGVFGIYPPGFVSQVVAFAFGLAAASFFPAIVLGIFSKRVGTAPAVCGMIAGIGFTAYYIIACVFFSMKPWTFGLFENGINPQGIGTFGMALNFIVTLALTPFFDEPRQEIKDMVDSVREPEGVGPAVDIETSAEH
jgi:cation/acetate symporter